MKKLITIADWVDDTMNVQEFKSVIGGYLKDPTCANLGFVNVTSSTIHTGYVAAQIIETEERCGLPQDTIVFLNTDPRLHVNEEKNDKGAEFIIVRLVSGIFVCGPNAEYNFSFVTDKIDELFHYELIHEETQFRSRDMYGRVCAHLMDEMEDELDLEEGPKDIIPEIRGHYVGHIDNTGNIKTTITHEEFKGKYEYGDLVDITIDTISKKARYVNSLFATQPNELVVYPGSSGKKGNPFLEISAWSHFNTKDLQTGVGFFKTARPGMGIVIGK